MSAQNQYAATWVKSQGTYFTGSTTVTGNHAVLSRIIIGTYTPGARFRVANGTATAIISYVTGSFVPQATGIQETIEFDFLEFPNGIYVETTGTLGLTAIYNDLV